MVQILRVSLTEKFMICLKNKCIFILYFSHIANFHNCIEMKYNYLDVIKYYASGHAVQWPSENEDSNSGLRPSKLLTTGGTSEVYKRNRKVWKAL